MRNLFPSFFCFVTLFVAFGCRLKVPTVQEEHVFLERGGFPGDPPLWLMSSFSNDRNSFPSPSSTSLIPLSFGSPKGAAVAEEVKNKSFLSRQSFLTMKKSSAEVQGIVSDERFLENIEIKNAMFEKTVHLCPRISVLLKQALREVRPLEQLSKFSLLVSQCPTSAELWLMLGKNHLKLNHSSEAKGCLKRVLSLDPGNKQAKGLLDKLEEKYE